MEIKSLSKLIEIKSWLSMFKNGHDLLGPGVLKSVVSQEGMDELS